MHQRTFFIFCGLTARGDKLHVLCHLKNIFKISALACYRGRLLLAFTKKCPADFSVRGKFLPIEPITKGKKCVQSLFCYKNALSWSIYLTLLKK